MFWKGRLESVVDCSDLGPHFSSDSNTWTKCLKTIDRSIQLSLKIIKINVVVFWTSKLRD